MQGDGGIRYPRNYLRLSRESGEGLSLDTSYRAAPFNCPVVMCVSLILFCTFHIFDLLYGSEIITDVCFQEPETVLLSLL